MSTVTKMTFQKNSLKELYYRDYKKIYQAVFKEELGHKLNNEIQSYETYEKIFIKTLDNQAPLRKNVLRRNYAPYLTESYYEQL